VTADTFTGEPGASSPVYEVDFAPRKRRCDVLLIGSAHAPEGRQVQRSRVSLQVGSIEKSFDVVGDRVWQHGLTTISASEPRRFVRMPISYDVAFGGVDRHSADEGEHDAYLPNPVGVGWHKHLKNAWVDGTPLPNTEEIGSPVVSPTAKLKAMALGPLGRGWPQRARFAGTYDQDWVDNVFPFLPADFDERYYQAAPEDQQLPLGRQALDVALIGFTADGARRFVLPHFDVPVQVIPKRGEREAYCGTLDTIVFEPDDERFTLTWRVTRPLKKSIFELTEARVGIAGGERWDSGVADAATLRETEPSFLSEAVGST